MKKITPGPTWNPPEWDGIKEIESLFSRIEELKETIKQIEQSIDEVVISARELPSEKAQEVVEYLYWCLPEVKANSLAKALGMSHGSGLYKRIENCSVTLRCIYCEEELEVESRTKLLSLQKQLNHRSEELRNSFVCSGCKGRHQQEVNERWRQQKAEEKEQINKLRSLPYREYLNSDHWKTRRLIHLKSALFRCQVCNAGNTTLDVHHRTYERLGCESYKDLIVLCRSCHTTFHESGKLAKP